MSNIATAQQILDGPWQHAVAARRSCRDATWTTFARETAPAKPLVFGRGDYARCAALAERSVAGPVTATLYLVPLWACITEDAPSAAWVAVHGLKFNDEPLKVREPAPLLDDASPRAEALWECQVRRWNPAIVVKSDDYGPSIPLVLRAGAFGVRELHLVEVLTVEVHASAPVPRPLEEVPMFANWFAPRVAVPVELANAIGALCFTADRERDGLRARLF